MYRYDNYTDSFVRIDGEPNTGSTTVRVGVPLKEAIIIEKVELTDECIDKIAKAVVHKMIDDAVIAEDAYPDLRQKMHDAVDEYEPQTDVYEYQNGEWAKPDCPWK